MFDSVFADSIVKRAIDKNLVTLNIENIRDYSEDKKHKKVDDYPYGGDPGMVLMPQPVAEAIVASKTRLCNYSPKVIFLTPQGELYNHSIAQEIAKEEALILLCGRYKGVDYRIREKYVDREISIGDYILSGGEIAAMVVLDTVVRLLPHVLGNKESVESDTFFYNGLLSPPHYTRPEVYDTMSVPEVLLSGHHEKIRQWKRQRAEELTRQRRPDIWEKYLSKSEENDKKI